MRRYFVRCVLNLCFARWRWIPIAGLAAVLGVAVWSVQFLEVDHANESLNIPDAERLATLQRFRSLFGSDEDLVVAWQDAELATAAGLRRVSLVTQRLREVPGVRAVFSLTNALQVVAGETGAVVQPLIPPPYERPGVKEELAATVQRMPELVGYLVSADLKTTGAWVSLGEEASHPQQAEAIIGGVRKVLDSLRAEGVTAHLTGVPVQKHDVTAYIQRDERILLPIAVFVLAAMLWVYFRHPVAVLLPLAIAGSTVLLIQAAMALLGVRVNAITALLPPVLLVLALTPSIHLLHFWLYRDDAPHQPATRVRAMLDHLLWRCFLCAATTASGFTALATSAMPAVREFGLAAAGGTLIGFALAMWLVPFGASVVLAPPARTRPRIDLEARAVRPFLALCGRVAGSWPGAVLVVGVAFGVAVGLGVFRLRNNTDLVRFLKPGAPLREDTFWIERHLGGPYPLEFWIERRDGTRLAHAADWQRIAAWAQTAMQEPGVTGALSLATLLRHVYAAEYRLPHPLLPHDDDAVEELLDFLSAVPDQGFVRRLISTDQTATRVQVRLSALGTAPTSETAERLLASAQRVLGPQYEVRVTGPLYHMARDSNRLVRQQVQSFALSFVLVGLLMAIALGSVQMGVVALVPNILPILATAGLLGLLNIDLSTGTAMIAAAAMGLVVDDTVHYIGAFGVNLSDTEPRSATQRTTLETGPALVANNLVVVAGFWVGVAGSFLPTIYFSLFTGVSLLLALMYDLLVTPACLLVLLRR
ncbi:MAG: MMPL family transporter [Candidatus Binatia bacterium]|nr:MMPL family transporter [Candidatus Binatia bacterium]